MDVYRIMQEEYADDLSGNGSRIFGGRWNSEGNYALYTSESRSLALLETLAHSPFKLLQKKVYCLVTIYVPGNNEMGIINPNDLPEGWNSAMPHTATKKTGDAFLKQKKQLILKIPSVMMPEEFNYLLNPLHGSYKSVTVKQKRIISFDDRIFSVI